MAVTHYSLSLLSYDDCPVRMTPSHVITLLKAWRKHHSFRSDCIACGRRLTFDAADDVSFTACCDRFYYDGSRTRYPVRSIAVRTPNYEFALPQLQKLLRGRLLRRDEESDTRGTPAPEATVDQEFVVLPDPVYWQVASTLVYEKAMKFASGLPVTNRTDNVLSPSKCPAFYRQLQEAPLNYGSLNKRSCGKATLIRQVAFGKRCVLSMRAMIVPDASLEPREIRLPDAVVRQFDLGGKWIILNRMPSLQPGNFVALRVATDDSWPHPCFGIPLEIVEALNADFDGDETNLYLVPDLLSQSECATLLDSKSRMGCFVMGLKLSPSQDMLVAYHLHYDRVDFLPYKERDLRRTFRVIHDLYGSEKTYECFDRMRRFYLTQLHDRTLFSLTLAEMRRLADAATTGGGGGGGRGRAGDDTPMTPEQFRDYVASGSDADGCLVTQVRANAKGSADHLYQMFGRMGRQNGREVKSSLWKGLSAVEAVHHATESVNALSRSGKIWEPGYGYSKTVFNLQGLTVDYAGRLVDGPRVVVERDVLRNVHHTSLMSTRAFRHLVATVLMAGPADARTPSPADGDPVDD